MDSSSDVNAMNQESQQVIFWRPKPDDKKRERIDSKKGWTQEADT